MYATDCPAFLEAIDEDPAMVALRVRDVLFQTGKRNNSLEDITTTGRRIQADAALRATRSTCQGDDPATLDVTALLPNPVRTEGTRIAFTAKGLPADDLRLDIYAANGALVGRFGLSEDDLARGYLDLDTRSLPAGVYQVTLWNGKEKASRSLLVY
jgi:hypothetical protein